MSVTEFNFVRSKIKVTMYDGSVVELFKPNTLQAESLEDRVRKINEKHKDNIDEAIFELSKLSKDFLCELGMTIEHCNELEPAHLGQIVNALVFEKKN